MVNQEKNKVDCKKIHAKQVRIKNVPHLCHNDFFSINSTNRRASELYNTSVVDNKLISSIEDDLGSEKDTYETDEKNYDELKEEQIIEKLEEKVNYYYSYAIK